jgi:hypothetical protein
LELGAPTVLRRADFEALLGDVEARHPGGRQMAREERHRITHAGAEVEHARLR